MLIGPFSLPELRRLLAGLLWRRPPSTTAVLHWSRWRRRHQACARYCHYQRHLREQLRL